MTAASLLSLLTRFFFLMLGILTTVNYVRRQDAINRDTALAFGTIALSVALSLLSDTFPTIPPFISNIGTLALIAQPYLLLRLVQYLHAAPGWIKRAGWMSMLFSWGCLLIFRSSSLPIPATLLIVSYFVIFNGYVMIIFIRGATEASGVTQRRLQLCALGSGLFALALLFIGSALILPTAQTVLNLLIQLSAIFSAGVFVLGFTPPRWLRNLWQFAELRQYLGHLSQINMTGANNIQILQELSQTAKQAIGGMAAMVVVQDTLQERWHIEVATEESRRGEIRIDDESAIQKVWQNQTATYLMTSPALNRADDDLLNEAEAESLIIVPINTEAHIFAILLVFLKHRSLFPQDDLELLKLLTQQSAVFLENFQLLVQLRQQLETRFARVLDTMAEAVISIDQSQQILLFNRSAERIFGYTAQEILGQRLEILLPPNVIQQHQTFVNDFAQGQDVARGMGERRTSLSAKHKNGTIFPIDASISKLTEGEEVILTVFIRDISAQKQAEAARRDIETRFTRVLDTMAEAVISINQSQHILLFNQSAEHMFGYTSAETLGQQLEMLLPLDVIQQHHQFVSQFASDQDIARGMGQRNAELFARRRDGTVFPIEASISKLTEDEDVILTVFIRDVTEQKQAAQALQQRHAYLTLQQQVTVAANESTSTEALLQQALELVCESIGLPLGHIYLPEEDMAQRLTPMPIWFLAEPERFSTFTSITEQTMVPAGVGVGCVLTDHRTHWYETVVDVPEFIRLDVARTAGIQTAIFVPVLVREEVVAVMEFFSDVSLPLNQALIEVLAHIGAQLGRVFEREHAERSLQQVNDALEQRVKERTAHLEAVNGELEAFSYSVSHDLRAPLRALDGFSQAIVEDYHDLLDEDGREYLDLIRFESQRMGQLIDDLIDLSRFTRTDLHWKPVNLSQIAEEIYQKLLTQDPQREGEFIIEPDLMICADQHLMQVVLENLLGNAWKYTSKQSWYQIELGSREEGELIYFVRDNGAGFDMAYVDKLFGAFQRLHAATEYEGTGIGLATVQRIIHRHGGQIRAEGAVDVGATFSFVLGQGHCD